MTRAVERISAVLETVASARGGMRLTDVAASADLAPATCHRLLCGLEQSGMLVRDPRTRRWQAGDRLARIATGVQPNPGLEPAVAGEALVLAERWDLGAYVATLSNGDCVCVAAIRPWRTHGPALGSVRPLRASAPALAILAALDRPVARALVAREPAPATGDDLGALELELDDVWRRGYAATFQGTRAAECATTFAGPPGEPPRALTLCGPAGRVHDALGRGLPATLLDTARAIEHGALSHDGNQN